MDAAQKLNPTKDVEKDELIFNEESEKCDTKISVEDNPDLPEKKRHTLAKAFSVFPIHMWLYCLYIVLALLLPFSGTLLIICGNWVNTGYFTLQALSSKPWPNLQVENANYHATTLELLQVRGIYDDLLLLLSPTLPASAPTCPPTAYLLDIWLLLLDVHLLRDLRHHDLHTAPLVSNFSPHSTSVLLLSAFASSTTMPSPQGHQAMEQAGVGQGQEGG